MLKAYISRTQQGFTLAELLVGLFVSSLLMGGTFILLSSTLRNNNDTTTAIQLNQELQSALTLMGNEIRRSGYWANAFNIINANTNTNPFMQSDTDVTINGAKNCILFSHDNNANGVISASNTVNDDERYGYRLNGTAIQTRPSTAPFSCTAGSNTWEDLTDRSTIEITALRFDQTDRVVNLDSNSQSSPKLVIRNVKITITGHHVDRPNLNKTLTYQVRLRNDKFIP